MMQDKLENTLNGGYAGLYGEVVTEDIYRLRSVRFRPDLIVDIGANVGVFTRFARSLFPDAKVVAVEPDPENAAHFRRFTPTLNVMLMEYALGSGTIFHGVGAVNGAHETYLSTGLGYPEKLMHQAVEAKKGLEISNVPCLLLSEILCPARWTPGMKTILKVDCEGAENSIWNHEPSMEVLRQMDYVAMEVHSYALTGAELPSVVKATREALDSLKKTHRCEQEGIYFWATKK